MQKPGSFSLRMCLVIGLAAALLACSPQDPQIPTPDTPLIPQLATPTPTPDNPLSPPEVTPTPTATIQIPAAPTVQPTTASARQHSLELRFTDPETQQECVTIFPFEVLEDGERSISGGGVIDCKFEKQQCGEGVCVTYHSTYAMDAELRGFVRSATDSYPDGMLEAYLSGEFSMTQYWTDIPPETVMAYTEANPFEISSSDIIPLAFQYQDGATTELGGEGGAAEYPWVFTLHLR